MKNKEKINDFYKIIILDLIIMNQMLPYEFLFNLNLSLKNIHYLDK